MVSKQEERLGWYRVRFDVDSTEDLSGAFNSRVDLEFLCLLLLGATLAAKPICKIHGF